MNDSPLYRSLFHTVERIAQNPPLPGDRRAISRCMQCIDDFYYEARITAEQWEALKVLLMDACV
jgi:hypothetical protein